MIHIYVLQHTASLRVYVGQTRNLRQRLRTHWRGTLRVDLALRRYGRDAFTCTLVESWETPEDADEAERFWIAFFRSTVREYGFNLTAGGRVMTDADLEKLRAGQLRRPPRSPEHRDKIRRTLQGQKHTLERRFNQSRAHLGKPGKHHPHPNGYASTFKAGGVAPCKGRVRVIIDGRVRMIERDKLDPYAVDITEDMQ